MSILFLKKYEQMFAFSKIVCYNAEKGGCFMSANISKQQQILDFINKTISESGYSPTVREICEAVGLSSPSTVHGYLKRLERDGVIKKEASKSRTLMTTQPNISHMEKEYLEVPVIGQVAAGTPLLAQENIERTFPLPMDFAKNGDVFMLKVKGDSMIEVGIFDGDFIIVKQQQTANNGEIVVALLDDSATVKRFYKENGHFRLQPENSSLDPIITDTVSVLGKVIGVYRVL